MSYRLPSEMRVKLKLPLGELLSEPDWDNPFITVGDECAYLAAKAGAEPVMMVYDNLIKRKEICDEKKNAIEDMPGKKVVVKNPATMITDEAEMAIRLGLESVPSKVEVDGEEDLLVLPCLIYAPDGMTIYYGQPNEGIVKVIVNQESKEKAKDILLSMEEVSQ